MAAGGWLKAVVALVLVMAMLAGGAYGAAAQTTDSFDGYFTLDVQGGVRGFGAADGYGSMTMNRARPTGLAATPSGRGYWVLDSAGGVFAFGDAAYRGSIPELRQQGMRIGEAQVVGLAATPSGRGYWVLDSAGGVFTFGDASYHGSIPGLLARGQHVPVPPAGMLRTASGRGYWIFDARGADYAFGDAKDHGGLTDGAPMVGAAAPWGATMGRLGAPAGDRWIALTFDDGPDPVATPRLLDELRRLGVPATFFVTGSAASRHPDLLRRMVAEDHSVQSHTWSHASLPTLSESVFTSEIAKTNDVIRAHTGMAPTCVRPPYGASNGTVVSRLHAMLLRAALWNIDPRDWTGVSGAEIEHHIESSMRPAAVVVLHDRSEAWRALDGLVRDLRSRGFWFTTVCDRSGLFPQEHM